MSREGFASEPAERHHRVAIAIALAVICAAFAIAYANSTLPLGHANLALPSSATVSAFGTGVTAYLIFVHARLSGRSGLLWLAGAYLFATCLAVAQALTTPGVSSEAVAPEAAAQTGLWLWIFWHIGFAALVLASQLAAAWQRRRRSGRPIRVRRTHVAIMMAVIFAGAVEAVLLATRWQMALPAIAGHDDSLGLWAFLPYVACLAITAAALVAVIGLSRGRTVLDLGLILAIAAALADVLLAPRAGVPFSLGWYAGRFASVVAGVALLAAYLREVSWLYGRVVRLGDRLADQAAIDAITGLSNRRHLNRQLEIALRDARRRGEDVSLLLLDIDHFSAYSLRYGHLAGEDCLRRIGVAVGSTARRPQDVIARYSAEEFAVLLPGTGNTGVLHVASVILETIHGLGIEHADNPPSGIVTVSAGAATVASGGRMEDLIRRADRALNAAKEAGRNRVVAHEAAAA